MLDSLMSRRGFLKRLGGVAIASSSMLSALPAVSALTSCSEASASEKRRKLVILHTNDVHSHIDPFPDSDPMNGGKGGYAKREALINAAIQEYGADNVMVFESGDMFQGTPYFNFYNGMLEMQLMNRMHIDAVTIGNHEFDNGVSALCDCMEVANFPFLSANYEFTDERGAKLVKPYKIFERGGYRVGVFGLGVRLAGLVAPKNCSSVNYLGLVPTAQSVVNKLRDVEGCDVVIALTHLGHADGPNGECDLMLAARTYGIDLILGGHSHTFLSEPVVMRNAKGHQVVINQVGFGGINVGKIVIGEDLATDVAMVESHNVTVA